MILFEDSGQSFLTLFQNHLIASMFLSEGGNTSVNDIKPTGWKEKEM